MAAVHDEITSLELGLGKASPILTKICSGKHIPQATLARKGGESFAISEAAVSCSVDALTDGVLIVRYLSGSMKHTKTGRVILLK